ARFVPGQPALIRDPHGAAVVRQPAAVDAGNVAVDVAVSERDHTCGCVGDAAAVAISRVLLDKAAVHGQLTSVGDTATVPARGTAPHHRAAGQGGGAAVEDAAARATRNVVLDRDVHQRQRALVQDRPAVRGDLAGRVT